MKVLVVGNPFDGLSVYGPFDDDNDIDVDAIAEARDETWWIVGVQTPKAVVEWK